MEENNKLKKKINELELLLQNTTKEQKKRDKAHKLKDEEQEEENKMLRELSKLKDSFLANVSHEIRTPLNGIVGMVAILLETAVTREQKEYLQITNNCSKNYIIFCCIFIKLCGF